MFLAYGVQRVDPAGGQLIQTCANGFEGGAVGQDLGGLLQRLVLIGGHQDGVRSAVPGDRDVLAAMRHLVEKFGEAGSELADGNGLGHGR